MNRDMLLSLYSYNTYANQLVLDTAARLSDEEFSRQASPSHGSVRDLLIHIVGSEAFFLKLCQGQPMPPRPDEPPTLAQMRAYFSVHAGEQENYLTSLADGDLQREVTFQMAGHEFLLPVWQLLIQAFVHSTHHRGELSIVLSQLGYPLPTLDIIIPFVVQSGQEWPWK